jgi:hypothetical protein
MARKPTKYVGYVLFDVLYEDGSQRSNRRVPADALGGLDGDEPARDIIAAQDAEIAEKSGRSRTRKSIAPARSRNRQWARPCAPAAGAAPRGADVTAAKRAARHP